MQIDIYSGGEYPADVLSNFTPRTFVIDGVTCASMEGFLQSLKFLSPSTQKRVCMLSGKEAKKCGENKRLWKWSKRVCWQGRIIKRESQEFTLLLLRAYQEMYKADARFRQALEDAKGYTLCHSIGKRDKLQTILTEDEFIFCLEFLQSNGAE